MKLIYSEKAGKELEEMDKSISDKFRQHLEKLLNMPPRRHLKFGVPYNVEDITKQARMVYELDGDVFYVMRCFKNHKEYKQWYSGFK